MRASQGVKVKESMTVRIQGRQLDVKESTMIKEEIKATLTGGIPILQYTEQYECTLKNSVGWGVFAVIVEGIDGKDHAVVIPESRPYSNPFITIRSSAYVEDKPYVEISIEDYNAIESC